MKIKYMSLLLATCFLLSGCGAGSYSPPDYSSHTNAYEAMYRTVLADIGKLKEGKPAIALQIGPFDWQGEFSGVKDDIWGYDLRSCDAADFDFSMVSDFGEISFNTDTVWPEDLPEGFDPGEILEFNKDPGLGIRALHERGITGEGVGIAVIDQALFQGHEQYKDNLMLYEEIHCGDISAKMHGSTVASIAVGKDIGVAPGAKLYYIASTFVHSSEGEEGFDASIIADCILRVLEINRQLPEDQKIRVISISMGYDKEDAGYEELTEAIELADKAGVFVITTTTSEFYDFSLFGMGRDYQDDPNDIHSYGPVNWIADMFYESPEFFLDRYLVPMGSRTYAGWTGSDDYEISNEGGLSWTVPWLAGFYALCCQVRPEMTPQEFIETVKSTAVTTEIEHEGKTYQFGKIIDPAAAIGALQAG